MIRKIGNEIWLKQDYNCCFGIYIYENKTSGHFILSNSFLLLQEYLIGKEKFSFNKDFADNFIVSRLCTPSIYETKEINLSGGFDTRLILSILLNSGVNIKDITIRTSIDKNILIKKILK